MTIVEKMLVRQAIELSAVIMKVESVADRLLVANITI